MSATQKTASPCSLGCGCAVYSMSEHSQLCPAVHVICDYCRAPLGRSALLGHMSKHITDQASTIRDLEAKYNFLMSRLSGTARPESLTNSKYGAVPEDMMMAQSTAKSPLHPASIYQSTHESDFEPPSWPVHRPFLQSSFSPPAAAASPSLDYIDPQRRNTSSASAATVPSSLPPGAAALGWAQQSAPNARPSPNPPGLFSSVSSGVPAAALSPSSVGYPIGSAPLTLGQQQSAPLSPNAFYIKGAGSALTGASSDSSPQYLDPNHAQPSSSSTSAPAPSPAPAPTPAPAPAPAPQPAAAAASSAAPKDFDLLEQQDFYWADIPREEARLLLTKHPTCYLFRLCSERTENVFALSYLKNNMMESVKIYRFPGEGVSGSKDRSTAVFASLKELTDALLPTRTPLTKIMLN